MTQKDSVDLSLREFKSIFLQAQWKLHIFNFREALLCKTSIFYWKLNKKFSIGPIACIIETAFFIGKVHMEESISLCTFIWKPSLLPFFQLFFCLLKDVHAQCLLKNIEFKGRSGSARGHSMLLTDILCGSWMSHRALSGGFTLDRKMVETLFYQQNTVSIFMI